MRRFETQKDIDGWFDATFTLTGPEIISLMRKHKRTIKDLSKEMGITMKRIREVRNSEGDPVLVGHTAIDWIQHITGSVPPRARAAYRQRMKS